MSDDFLVFNGEKYYKPKRITNHVFVGSRATAADPVFLKKNNIKLVVNCTKDQPKFSDIPMLRVPVNDSPSDADKMSKYLRMASLAIRDVTRYGGNVYIHCFAGMNRSATVCAAYLMTIKGLTADEAMKIIKKKKPECFTPMNFKPALKNYEAELIANGIIKKTKNVKKNVVVKKPVNKTKNPVNKTKNKK